MSTKKNRFFGHFFFVVVNDIFVMVNTNVVSIFKLGLQPNCLAVAKLWEVKMLFRSV